MPREKLVKSLVSHQILYRGLLFVSTDKESKSDKIRPLEDPDVESQRQTGDSYVVGELCDYVTASFEVSLVLHQFWLARSCFNTYSTRATCEHYWTGIIFCFKLHFDCSQWQRVELRLLGSEAAQNPATGAKNRGSLQWKHWLPAPLQAVFTLTPLFSVNYWNVWLLIKAYSGDRKQARFVPCCFLYCLQMFIDFVPIRFLRS